VPLQPENAASANLFLPEFIHRFLPDRKSLEPILDSRFFTRVRRFSLEITLALMLNMVRPGERVGYQKVIDRFFSETGLAFPQDLCVKPPDKGLSSGPGRKFQPRFFKSCSLRRLTRRNL
jgi:hypothetical protein